MNIVVLCGGLSNERDVSLSSGSGVARALFARGHKVLLLDLYLGYEKAFENAEEVFSRGDTLLEHSVKEGLPDIGALRALRGEDKGRVGPNIIELCRAADISFLALHGEEGENGKVQAMLDLFGIKYTGSGYLGSALAMNKALSKNLFQKNGIATPDGITVSKKDAVHENVGFPCVVKPCSGGSSVGTSIAWTTAEYEAALSDAFRYEDKVIVERFIKGRELTVGVINGAAMPVIEIIPKSGFYDYKNKYQAGATIEICPAPIDAKTTKRVQDLAERVMSALMIDAYCRCDFLWCEETGEIYCLEANTLPGMTPTSLIPQMGEALGMDYGALCERIIEISLGKYDI